ncbi:hypothetical protein EYZ11_006195 [Aspergillus tanneri]|uniref:Uncharacterized protein n=1 Tax=Aspergillus tanneri TaxID=1220188 RepID=A0A4S3JG29_9EURO|nr:hypothetical protein EYZ11_006195 [Aspergillus tanneri]
MKKGIDESSHGTQLLPYCNPDK